MLKRSQWCWCVAVGAVLALASCKRTNGLYCDANDPCRDPTRPHCDSIAHECVATTVGNNDLSVADLTGGCQSSSQCPDSTPICDAGNCRACSGTSDNSECVVHKSSTPYCNAQTGLCNQCTQATQATDCAAATPVCGDGTCRTCANHSECSSGICIFDGPNLGRCADPTQIAYVDSKGSVATCNTNGMTHDGNSPATAYCDLQPGVGSGKPFILVTGHGNTGGAYGSISITTSVTTTIVGPGQGVANPALTFDVANDQVSVMPSGGAGVFLIIDGLELGDRTNPTAQNGINCNATGGSSAKIIVRRSAIQHNGKNGITATNCDITVDQTFIGPANSAGGVYIKTSDFTIQNSVIHDNGSTTTNFGGIQIAGLGTAGRGRIINDDVVDNASQNSGGKYSGIDCAMGTVVVLNTALIGNTSGTATELRSSCSTDHSAFVGATGTNTSLMNCTDATVFSNPTNFDYHPRTSATAPCATTLLGKGVTSFMGATAPWYDFYGAPRPQPANSAPDIGAIESAQ